MLEALRAKTHVLAESAKQLASWPTDIVETTTRSDRTDVLDVEVVQGFAEALPFPDESFDAVVTTMVLCSVKDPHQTMSEVARVLRPGGRWLFWEHVRADSDAVSKISSRTDFSAAWTTSLLGTAQVRDIGFKKKCTTCLKCARLCLNAPLALSGRIQPAAGCSGGRLSP
jgi:SAM-dependent methyltransferase